MTGGKAFRLAFGARKGASVIESEGGTNPSASIWGEREVLPASRKGLETPLRFMFWSGKRGGSLRRQEERLGLLGRYSAFA
jgi:hypothetical protein